jgi:hypothetical protein
VEIRLFQSWIDHDGYYEWIQDSLIETEEIRGALSGVYTRTRTVFVQDIQRMIFVLIVTWTVTGEI